MGYLDKSAQTVTAHFTKLGRELLAEALSGDTSGRYEITQFTLGDDEIDYSLYDETQSTNLRGRVIENMPLLESFINEQEIMNYFITDAPEMSLPFQISSIPAQITLTGKNDIVDISPITENLNEKVKWILAITMLIGRLEIFTILVLFSKNFWKK